ncbi:hypothetical protein GCM10010519_56830 [Streptomyces lactacystinicus]
MPVACDSVPAGAQHPGPGRSLKDPRQPVGRADVPREAFARGGAGNGGSSARRRPEAGGDAQVPSAGVEFARADGGREEGKGRAAGVLGAADGRETGVAVGDFDELAALSAVGAPASGGGVVLFPPGRAVEQEVGGADFSRRVFGRAWTSPISSDTNEGPVPSRPVPERGGQVRASGDAVGGRGAAVAEVAGRGINP